MKTKLVPVLLIVVASAFTSFVAKPALAQGNKTVPEKLLAMAKVTRSEAEKIVLKAVPDATIKEIELEEEDGGLRWSFDLKTPGSKRITEVAVDAMTGKVVENKVESAKDEAKETDDEDEKSQKGEAGKGKNND